LAFCVNSEQTTERLVIEANCGAYTEKNGSKIEVKFLLTITKNRSNLNKKLGKIWVGYRYKKCTICDWP